MSALRLEAAALGYPGATVLRGVELALHAGEFVAIVGGNGSGKTTLLRSILGVLPVLGGTLHRDPGVRVGYVPQQLGLDRRFPLSASEVVAMGLWRGRRLLGRSGAEDAARVHDSLERVDMLGHGHRAYAELSGGQRQRVLVARALASAPDLLLLDEPTAGVDARASEAIHAVLRELHGEGMTILVVTHHPADLRDDLQRAWRLAEGSLVEVTPAEAASG